MKKERNIAVVLLLTLILITLVILCLLLVTNRLGGLGQSEEKQATMMEELEQKEGQKPKMCIRDSHNTIIQEPPETAPVFCEY